MLIFRGFNAMTDADDQLLTLTADIVRAHVANNSVSVNDVALLIASVFGALAGLGDTHGHASAVPAALHKPAVTVFPSKARRATSAAGISVGGVGHRFSRKAVMRLKSISARWTPSTSSRRTTNSGRFAARLGCPHSRLRGPANAIAARANRARHNPSTIYFVGSPSGRRAKVPSTTSRKLRSSRRTRRLFVAASKFDRASGPALRRTR